MNLNRMAPRAWPSTMPAVRALTACPPTVDAGSVSTCTMAVACRTSTTRPARPPGGDHGHEPPDVVLAPAVDGRAIAPNHPTRGR